MLNSDSEGSLKGKVEVGSQRIACKSRSLRADRGGRLCRNAFSLFVAALFPITIIPVVHAQLH